MKASDSFTTLPAAAVRLLMTAALKHDPDWESPVQGDEETGREKFADGCMYSVSHVHEIVRGKEVGGIRLNCTVDPHNVPTGPSFSRFYPFTELRQVKLVVKSVSL